jgi:hypothetical protein
MVGMDSIRSDRGTTQDNNSKMSSSGSKGRRCFHHIAADSLAVLCSSYHGSSLFCRFLLNSLIESSVCTRQLRK